jgi:replicative DNA helicase
MSSDLNHLRVPPSSIEAESSVLGGLLLDNQSFDAVSDLIHAKDFYKFEHQQIYAAIEWLVDGGKPADVITTFERLQGLAVAEDVGGLAYINSLAQYVPSTSNIRRYAEIVRDRSVLRNLISVGDTVVGMGFNPQGRTTAEIIDEAERKIFEVGESGRKGRQNVQDISALAVAMIDRVDELSQSSSDVTGLASGFYDLDRHTAGFQPGDLIILAARPSMGKTALAINIAENAAIDRSVPVAVFSMEMGGSQLATRIVGSIGRIDQNHLRTGKLTTDEWARFPEAIEKLRDVRLKIDETPGMTASELRSSARKIAREFNGLGLIVVDYLQLMSSSGKSSDENGATELGEISRSLKMLARELNCPIIALSQLNRGVEQRTDKRPMMSDLRESGAIEQDADIIMMLYRDEYYTKEACKDPGVAELLIVKQRNGPTGTVKLAFVGKHTRFENLARSSERGDY